MYGLAYFHILKYSYTNCSRKISVHVLSTNNDQILNWRLDKNRWLYWATAIMAFLFNTLYAALSIWNLIFHNKPAIISCLIDHNCSVLSDANIYKDEVLTLLPVTISSAVLIELLVSVLAVKYDFRDQRSPRDD